MARGRALTRTSPIMSFPSSGNFYTVTPSTPPRAATNEYQLDVDGVQSPMSEYESSGGGAHSPSFSDASYDHRPERLYIPDFGQYRCLPSPASPTSPAAHRMGLYLDSPLLTPESSTSLNINGLQLEPHGTLSPVFPLLSFPLCGPGVEEECDRSPILSSPEEPGPDSALFGLPPAFVFHSEPDDPTEYSRSRAWSGTTTNNGLLMAPRRHSFAAQRPRHDDGFFPSFESGASTPSTSSYSSFPSSPYSDGSTAHLLAPATPELSSPRRRHVASVAGVRAANRRRKHPGKFSCPESGCPQTFTTMHNLRNHRNSHAGVKPYACERLDCDGRFTTLSVKRRHELKCRFPLPASTSFIA
ncbi:hypothetical protein B0H16DRAFT_1540655 [Mycena metata]|uniref:C2H2-type domain-containing protein n=1 Tax=Mycena metata TaxID=1033252 RepID=A0AAD7J6F0_9AGAR|nr:hypothetical protein B0H16DRAFT_1540655 [Mycena metata]